MSQLYKGRRLTNKERFDQRTMLYFFPKSGGKVRVRYNDRIKMAQLSSNGLQPKNRTRGFLKLLWGKTYRDLQITQWSDDIKEGFITKSEIYESLPTWMKNWAERKLTQVPYDTEGKSSEMWIRMYHNG